MITVGAFEAKTHLSTLLEKVANGEEVVITKHGKPIARMIAAKIDAHGRVDEAIEQLLSLREGTKLGDLDWKHLRDEGRR